MFIFILAFKTNCVVGRGCDLKKNVNRKYQKMSLSHYVERKTELPLPSSYRPQGEIWKWFSTLWSESVGPST